MFPLVTRVIASPVRAGRPHEDGRATWVLDPHLTTYELRGRGLPVSGLVEAIRRLIAWRKKKRSA